MSPDTVNAAIMGALAFIAFVILVVPVGMYLYKVFQEVTDESAEHSSIRREEYASARLRIVLMGFVSMLGLVGFTVLLMVVI